MALILALPVGVIAAVPMDTPEQAVEAYDSTTRGAVQVNGDTTDWFHLDKNGKAIDPLPKLLNGTLAVEPGEYEVVVNKTARKVKVEAGKKVVLAAGTLVVEGEGLYYSPLVGDEKKVASNRNDPGLGSGIALFPGTYAVDVNVNHRSVRRTETAEIVPGKKLTVK